MRLFFGDHDVLLLPTSQVPPFPVEQEFPETINGQEMPDYLAWMRSAYFITVTGCPAISVPAGRTPDGLPVGVQLVARHGADRQLLEVAAAVEALLALTPGSPLQVPAVVRPAFEADYRVGCARTCGRRCAQRRSGWG